MRLPESGPIVRKLVVSFAPAIYNYVLVDVDDPTPPEKQPCTVRTFVRPLDKFPPNFEARANANGKGVITSVNNERMLLNSLLGGV